MFLLFKIPLEDFPLTIMSSGETCALNARSQALSTHLAALHVLQHWMLQLLCCYCWAVTSQCHVHGALNIQGSLSYLGVKDYYRHNYNHFVGGWQTQVT